MPATALRRAGAAALLFTAAASAPAYASDPAPCDHHLQSGHTYHAHQHTFVTDSAGRPSDALAKTLTAKAAERGECEKTVGNWGGEGDWQGGHLIAASFDGVSMRYNLVPMRGRQINQGLMKRVENGARACLEGEGTVSDYRVRPHYPDGKTITPDQVTITMSPKKGRISFTLPNRTLSAKELRSWQDRITKTFEETGCGKK
ncbi:DNA/RNA non-specific endonuclease [Nonomuraea solani]|uniref:DNA/RNA non-specific endonuclease n=1 Tax=Nonomuraea solani TaxID=1144553 RepID=A0A1H6EXL8_9ACTN|nr:DNA/RNA non-specific endonuclease [Nonomuraea solani]SEH01374.1 DNA/RNA non-specific endonuclease [Nonomuraea solani]